MRFGALLVLFVGFILITSSPAFKESRFARAEGSAADLMCAKANPECPCAKVKNPQTGKCEQKSIAENPYMCPLYCKDTTQGHVTQGTCVAPFRCKGELCDGKECKQDKGEGMKPPELPKPPESKGGGEKPPEGQQDPCANRDPSATSTDPSAASDDQCASSVGGFDTSSASTSGFGGSFGGFDYGSYSGSEAMNPFISLLDGLQSGQTGIAPFVNGTGVSANFGGTGGLRPEDEPTSARPFNSGRAISIGGATGFAPPIGFGASSENDEDNPSLIETVGDIISSAGDAVGDVVNDAVEFVRSVVGGDEQATDVGSASGEVSDDGTAKASSTAPQTDGPTERVSGSVSAEGNPASEGTQIEGKIPDASLEETDASSGGGRETQQADTSTADDSGQQQPVAEDAGNPQRAGTAPGTGTPVVGQNPTGGSVSRTPSLPTAVVEYSDTQQESIILELLTRIFGSVNLLLTELASFLRGFFSVFSQ